MASTDVATRVAQEVADWLDTVPKKVADALLESVYRPRVVEPTKAETVAYFRSLLVNPDGTLNEQGKQSVIQQYGASYYEEIAKAVAKAITAEKDAILKEASITMPSPFGDVRMAFDPTRVGGPPPAPGAPALQPIRSRPPTNTQLILGQLPEPGPGGTPLLATPGGA